MRRIPKIRGIPAFGGNHARARTHRTVVKTLLDFGVNMMIASEYELGISTLLNQHGITEITVLVGTVSQILQEGSAESSKMKEANRYMVQKCVGCPTTTIYYSGTL